jgi:hypothetical protein
MLLVPQQYELVRLKVGYCIPGSSQQHSAGRTNDFRSSYEVSHDPWY